MAAVCKPSLRLAASWAVSQPAPNSQLAPGCALEWPICASRIPLGLDGSRAPILVQVIGPHHPGIYYVASIASATYEHPLQPGESAYARWRTDIRVDYRIRPPLLRSGLLADATLGSFRPFHGFQGSNVPLPPDISAALAKRAAPRLVTVPRPGG